MYPITVYEYIVRLLIVWDELTLSRSDFTHSSQQYSIQRLFDSIDDFTF